MLKHITQLTWGGLGEAPRSHTHPLRLHEYIADWWLLGWWCWLENVNLSPIPANKLNVQGCLQLCSLALSFLNLRYQLYWQSKTTSKSLTVISQWEMILNSEVHPTILMKELTVNDSPIVSGSPSSRGKPGPWARPGCTGHWLYWRAEAGTPQSYWHGCHRASVMETGWQKYTDEEEKEEGMNGGKFSFVS